MSARDADRATPRAWLGAAALPLVVFGAYVALARQPVEREVAELRAQLADVTARVEPPAADADVARRTGEVSAELAAVRAAAEEEGERLALESSVDRARIRQLVSERLERHGLTLVTEQQEEQRVDAQLERTVRAPRFASGTRLRVVTLELRGDYRGAWGALREFGEDRPGLVPLRVQMRVVEGDDDGHIVWTWVLA